MKQAKISIVIIHYNTPHFLRTCLDAIFAQTYQNIEVIFIDNNSPDKSGLEFVVENYKDKENLIIVPNEDNLGYAKAANQGIKMATGDFVVITNPDIIYTPEYFENIMEKVAADDKIAAITGKVYKYDFENKKTTKIIDTVGLFAYKNRRVIDDGQGLTDEGQFDEEREIFGISGACPLYRKAALEDVKLFDEYLDEDFFMYKEDVDLSWRFLLFGWKNYYYPKAIAYHGRGTGIVQRFSNKQVMENRKKLSKFQKDFSFKNQNLMEVKNDLWANKLKDIHHILFRKAATFVYITLFEPYLWKSYLKFLKQLPSAIKKRKEIQRRMRVTAKEMEKWFRKQSDYLKK